MAASANALSARNEARAHPAEQGEHRARQSGAALEVEDAELLADLPVGHPLVRPYSGAGRPSSIPGHHRRSSTLSSGPPRPGSPPTGGSGASEQRVPDRRLGGVGRGAGLTLAIAEGPALFVERGGAGRFSRLASANRRDSSFTWARRVSSVPLQLTGAASSVATRSTSARSTPRRPSAHGDRVGSSRMSRTSIMAGNATGAVADVRQPSR